MWCEGCKWIQDNPKEACFGICFSPDRPSDYSCQHKESEYYKKNRKTLEKDERDITMENK